MPDYNDKPFVALIDGQHYQSEQNRDYHDDKTQTFSVIEMDDPRSDKRKRHYLTASSTVKSSPTIKSVYEIQSIAHSRSSKYSSFFVGARVVSNPSLHIVNRVDPMFFILSYFESESNQTEKWQPWNQLCESKKIHSTIKHIMKNDKSQLRHFFNINDSLLLSDGEGEGTNNDDLILYKFQSDKALTWLKAKVHNVELTLQKQFKSRRKHELRVKQMEERQGKKNGAFSASFILSNNHSESTSTSDNQCQHKNNIEDDKKSTELTNNEVDDTTIATKPKETIITLTTDEEKQILKSSIQIVCEYLAPSWQSRLLEYLKMNMDDVLNTQKKLKPNGNNTSPMNTNHSSELASTPSLATSPPFNERQLTESEKLLQYTMGSGSNDNQQSDSKDNKRKRQEAKSLGLKKLQKVNTKGMKSLSSYFGATKTKK